MTPNDLDPPDLPLLIRASSVEFQSFTDRLGLHFRVQSDGRGIPVHGWRIGESGSLTVSNVDGALLGVGIDRSDGGAALNWSVLEVEDFEELETAVRWGDTAVGKVIEVEGGKQNQIWFGDRQPSCWKRLRGTELFVGLDDAGQLAVFVFSTPIVVASTRSMSFRIDGKLHAAAYGDRGFSIGVLPDMDEADMFGSDAVWEAPAACPVFEQLESPDGAFSLALRPDGIVEGINGPVDCVEPVAVNEVDETLPEVAVFLMWPCSVRTRVEVLDETHARIAVEFGESDPVKWIEVAGGLLVGLTDENGIL